MTLLADFQIRNLCHKGGYDSLGDFYGTHHEPRLDRRLRKPMIEPFVDYNREPGKVSFGLDHAGYCLRLAPEYKVFKNTGGEPIDPKRFKEEGYESRVLDSFVETKPYIVLPPHSYILASSYEYIRMPDWLKGRCVGKSTYARCCVLTNLTPLEPGWEGTLTIEIGNQTSSLVHLWVMEGIAQLEFEKLDATPEMTYRDKKGKYQCQRGVTPARVI